MSENNEKLYYACAEHVDYILDDCIYEEETFPEMNKIPEDSLCITCAYCKKDAVYIVENIHSHT